MRARSRRGRGRGSARRPCGRCSIVCDGAALFESVHATRRLAHAIDVSPRTNHRCVRHACRFWAPVAEWATAFSAFSKRKHDLETDPRGHAHQGTPSVRSAGTAHGTYPRPGHRSTGTTCTTTASPSQPAGVLVPARSARRMTQHRATIDVIAPPELKLLKVILRRGAAARRRIARRSRL